MKKIVIDLDGDIDKAIAEIDDLIMQIESFGRQVAVEGAEYAKERYEGYTADTSNGNQIGYGKAMVMVTAEPGENAKSTVIRASGEEVCFAEWGTGRHAEVDPRAPVPTGKASYSEAHDGQLIRNMERGKDYWYYRNERHYGSYPTYAMTHTIEYLRENTVNIAKEYFK